MKHLQSNGVVVTAYCFDGFQVPLIRTLARSSCTNLAVTYHFALFLSGTEIGHGRAYGPN